MRRAFVLVTSSSSGTLSMIRRSVNVVLLVLCSVSVTVTCSPGRGVFGDSEYSVVSASVGFGGDCVTPMSKNTRMIALALISPGWSVSNPVMKNTNSRRMVPSNLFVYETPPPVEMVVL